MATATATATAALPSTNINSSGLACRSDDSEDVLSMTVSTFEEMNPKRRSTMEDCHVVHTPGTWRAPDPGMAFLGVYDGHGGRDMAEYLEEFLAFHVSQELKHNDDASLAVRLERAFVIADIHATQCGVKTSGATVLVCLAKKLPGTNRIRIHSANAGDARAVLGHQGKATRLSHDHRVDDPTEVQRIEEAGGFLFRGRVLGVLAVTRSLGDHCMKVFVVAKPHYNEITIDMGRVTTGQQLDNNNDNDDPPTFLILACDGLWDVMEDQEAVELALDFLGDKTQVAQFLVEEAIRRGSADNVSVVVSWLS